MKGNTLFGLLLIILSHSHLLAGAASEKITDGKPLYQQYCMVYHGKNRTGGEGIGSYGDRVISHR